MLKYFENKIILHTQHIGKGSIISMKRVTIGINKMLLMELSSWWSMNIKLMSCTPKPYGIWDNKPVNIGKNWNKCNLNIDILLSISSNKIHKIIALMKYPTK